MALNVAFAAGRSEIHSAVGVAVVLKKSHQNKKATTAAETARIHGIGLLRSGREWAMIGIGAYRFGEQTPGLSAQALNGSAQYPSVLVLAEIGGFELVDQLLQRGHVCRISGLLGLHGVDQHLVKQAELV